MPNLHAFRGIRYDLGHVGSLSEVIAPPYDVINEEQQDELYKSHPANCVRLILNRHEPGDDDGNNRYTRASRFLKNWLHEGVMLTEADPAIYVYHQVFTYGGEEYTRRGFMAACELVRFGEGNIYPHEETHSAAKADRLKLVKTCKANLSQIFGIYPDAENKAQSILEEAIIGVTPLEATDHLGVVHRMWPVFDVKVIADVQAVMGEKPMFIADGHHRYETGCNYKEHLKENGDPAADGAGGSILMMCVGMDDPGMIVLPTHRLFRGLPSLSSSELVTKLGDLFDVKVAGQGAELADELWTEIETEDEQGTIALYCSKDDTWVMARISEAGRQKMSEIASDHSSDWQGLGVSILQRLIIETALDAGDLPKPKYVHLVSEAVDGIQEEEDFPLVALVMPATLDHIRAISEHGERMPAKSTYFYPKLLSGLVVKSLE